MHFCSQCVSLQFCTVFCCMFQMLLFVFPVCCQILYCVKYQMSTEILADTVHVSTIETFHGNLARKLEGEKWKKFPCP
jgi:hypothetical protein